MRFTIAWRFVLLYACLVVIVYIWLVAALDVVYGCGYLFGCVLDIWVVGWLLGLFWCLVLLCLLFGCCVGCADFDCAGVVVLLAVEFLWSRSCVLLVYSCFLWFAIMLVWFC